MAKLNIAQLPAKLYELLSPLDKDERSRVIQATLVLFGEQNERGTTSSGDTSVVNSDQQNVPVNDPASYFDKKEPRNKGEELAVAARFREQKQHKDTHSKSDLKQVITDARRNFDSRHFARDLNNAKRQAGFFNLGTKPDASQLSYYGQQYVDALPNREKITKLKKPKVKKHSNNKTRARGLAK